MSKAKRAASTSTHNINAALSTEQFLRGVDDLRLDDDNARAHDARSIDAIGASLSRFGQQKPIVVVDGRVIAGNGTLLAARALGWTHIAVVEFPDLAAARAYAIADNRTAELSTWDTAALARALDDINASDMLHHTGFSVDDMMRVVGEATAAAEVAIADPVDRPLSPEVAALQRAGTALGPANTSHVRMVQLFMNDETQPLFMEWARALSAALGKDNVTDTVYEAVRLAYETLGLDKMKAAPVDNAE